METRCSRGTLAIRSERTSSSKRIHGRRVAAVAEADHLLTTGSSVHVHQTCSRWVAVVLLKSPRITISVVGRREESINGKQLTYLQV